MEIAMEKLVGRFRDYVSYDTQSDEDNEQECPSTPQQLLFAKHLAEELREIGLSEVKLDQHGYIMATLPANNGQAAPVIGFIAHMDTSPDAAGRNVKPHIVRHYGGRDIVLNEAKNIILSPHDFPELLAYKGQDIMVTDGTTLLGADDKAGICAIVSAAEYLLEHPAVRHGRLRLAFTPDEETGRSADRFDVAEFAADFAYTVDGGAIGGLEYENFNAANACICFRGRSVHTGDAKHKMINALSIAAEWQMMLPAGEKPETTEGHEGFFHVHKLEGDVEEAKMMMLIRDHDRAKFEARKAYLAEMAAFLCQKYGDGAVRVDSHDVYYNMKEKIAAAPETVRIAEAAMREAGVEPQSLPIRGGTDGARLSFMGLPCPNLFTGGMNYHGRFEYLPLPSLQKAAVTVLNIMCHENK